MRNVLPILLLWLLAGLNAQGDGSVWVVQSGANRLYLGGTCHVLRPTDYPLPASYDQAYQAARAIVMEIDLARMDDPDVQALILRKAIYQDGTTLKQKLATEVYRALMQACSRAGLPEASVAKMKPSLAIITLTLAGLQKLGVDPNSGVDQHFYKRATKDGKPISGLETMEEQVDLIAAMGQGNENRFVRYSLKDLDDLPRIFADIVEAWRSGDLESLEKLFVQEMQEEAPELYQDVIVARNRHWLPSIERFLESAEVEFVLVGVGHLVGPDGIVEQLKAKGYSVTHLNTPALSR